MKLPEWIHKHCLRRICQISSPRESMEHLAQSAAGYFRKRKNLEPEARERKKIFKKTDLEMKKRIKGKGI